MVLPYDTVRFLLGKILGKKVVFSTQELDRFLESMIRFEEWRKETNGRLKLKIGSPEYYSFLSLISNAVYSLNFFISAFIVEFEKKNSCLEAYSEPKKFSRFVRFWNGLIVTNIRKYFFRELPAQANNFPLLNLDRTIFEDAITIYQKWKKFENIKKEVSRLLFFYYLMFSFIYKSKSSDIIEGVFSDFALDYNLFSKIVGNFIKLFDRLENIHSSDEFEVFLRKILKNSRALAIACSLNEEFDFEKFVFEENELFWSMKPEIYKKFTQRFEESEEVFLEPFSWWMAGFLRKLDGAIQDMDEFMDEKDKENILREIIKKVSYSFKEFRRELESFYPINLRQFKDSTRPVYEKLYENFSEPINYLWEEILVHRHPEDFYKKDIIPAQKLNLSLSPKKEFKQSLKNIYERYKEEGLKLKNLFQNLSQEEFNELLFSFVDIIRRKENFLKNYEFVGIYTSGVFLAHLVNFYLNLNKNVWLFKVYPHALTHPIHEDRKWSFRIALFDESIKTMFSVSIYENYLLRNTHTIDHSLKIFSLFDFEEYPKLSLKCTPEIFALVKVGSKNLKFEFVGENCNTENIIEIAFLSKNQLIEIVKNFFEKNSKTGRLNFYELLMDSSFLFSIGKFFSEKINEFEGSRIGILPYSAEGEIIAFVVAWFLKNSGKYIYFIDESSYGIPQNLDLIVGVDLSKDTGFTKDYKLQKMKNLRNLTFPSLHDFFLFERKENGKWLFLDTPI